VDSLTRTSNQEVNVRVLSPHLNYSVQVFEGSEKRETDPVTGQSYTRTERMPLVADFEQGGLFPHETELALRVFAGVWKGLPEGVNPVTRISCYDTEAEAIAKGWASDYHEKVDERLRHLAGLAPSRMIVAEDIKQPKPWPLYDEQDEDEVFAYVEALGISPDTILLYENENLARPELIARLRALREAHSAEVAVVSA
jgi:hypothetical protein